MAATDSMKAPFGRSVCLRDYWNFSRVKVAEVNPDGTLLITGSRADASTGPVRVVVGQVMSNDGPVPMGYLSCESDDRELWWRFNVGGTLDYLPVDFIENLMDVVSTARSQLIATDPKARA